MLISECNVPATSWKELLLVALLLLVVAALVLGANPLAGETVAPMDLLQVEPGWQELELELAGSSPHRTDILDGLLPRWIFLKKSLRSGKLPTWNPLPGFGEPCWQLLFNAHLTPRFMLFVLFDDALGFYLGLLFQLVLAGLGTYVLARRFVGIGAGFFAAFTYMLCGFNVSWIMWTHTSTAAMIPWVVWALLRVFDNHARPRVLATFAAIVALMVFGGFPAVSAYAIYLCAGLTAVWAVREVLAGTPPVQVVKITALAALAGVLGLGIAAVQLLPSVEYLGTFDLAYRGPLGAAVHARTLLLNPLPGGLAPDPETCGYLGVTALVMMLIGAAPWRRSDRHDLGASSRMWVAAVIASLVLVLRFPRPIADLLYHLPALSSNPNNRVLVIFGLAGAVLAGIGAHRLIEVVSCRSRKGMPLLLVLLVGVQIVDLARVSRAQNGVVPGAAFLPTTSVTRWLEEHLEPGQAVIAEGFLTGGTISSYGFGELFSHRFFTNAEKELLNRLVEDAWLSESAARPGIARARLENSTFFDLLSVRYLVAPCSTMRVRLMPGEAKHLQADEPLTLQAGEMLLRVLPVDRVSEIRGVALLVGGPRGGSAEIEITIRDQNGLAVGSGRGETTNRGVVTWLEIGFDQISVLEPGRYLMEITGSSGSTVVWAHGMQPVYDLLSEIDLPADLGSHWSIAKRSAGICVLENRGAPSGAMLLQLHASMHDPHAALGAVEKIAATSFRTTTDQPARLVRSTRTYPGWSVWVDGEEAASEVAIGGLQSVKVPAGETLVEWRFKSHCLRIGIVISLLSLLVTIVLALRRNQSTVSTRVV